MSVEHFFYLIISLTYYILVLLIDNLIIRFKDTNFIDIISKTLLVSRYFFNDSIINEEIGNT